MTATIIPITQSHRKEDPRIKAAREQGFGMAVKKIFDAVMASEEPISKQGLQLYLLLLKPE